MFKLIVSLSIKNMKLSDAKVGFTFEVISISNEKLLSDALRFGIETNSRLKVIAKLPGGPVVIQKEELQIAIGKNLAEAIEVREK